MKDKSGVTPVVGTILIIVLTIFMVTSVATYVFAIKLPEGEPQASLEATVTAIDNENVEITLIHKGGESIQASDLKILATDEKGIIHTVVIGAEVLGPGDTIKGVFKYSDNISPFARTTVRVIHEPSKMLILSAPETRISGIPIAYGASITVESGYVLGEPGQEFNFTLTIGNYGSIKDTYDIEVSDDFGWSDRSDCGDPPIERCISVDDMVTLPAYSYTYKNLHVWIPPDAEGGRTNNITVTITSRNDPWLSPSCEVRVEVILTYGVSVNIEPGYQAEDLGENLTYEVTVQNRGSVEDNFSLEITQDLNWTITDENGIDLPENLTIPANSSWTENMIVVIPGDAERGTMNTIVVEAQSVTDPEKTHSDSCQAQVIKPVMFLPPTYQRGDNNDPKTGEPDVLTFVVRVTNRRDVGDTFSLEAQDDLSWDISLIGSVTLQAKGSVDVNLTVTVPADAGAGINNLVVTATSLSDPSITDSDNAQVEVPASFPVCAEPTPLVDGSERIGLTADSYVDAQTKDDTYEQIQENSQPFSYRYVQSETVDEGGTDGISSAQGDDGNYENLYEDDYGTPVSDSYAYVSSWDNITGTILNPTNQQDNDDEGAYTILREGTTEMSTTYDYSSGAGTDKWAWDTTSTDYYPARNMADATDGQDYLTDAEYALIAADDADRYNSVDPGLYDYATLGAKFTISEAVADITQITGYWKGHSDSGGDYDGLFIYNNTTDSFEKLAEVNDPTDTTTDAELTGSITANFSDYIDADGYLYLLATHNDTSEDSFVTNYIYVEVTTLPYSMEIYENIADVPAGDGYFLELRYALNNTNDSFRVQVWNGSTWENRGDVLDSTSWTSWSYQLAPSELTGDGDDVQVKFVDVNPEASSATDLMIDWLRVRSHTNAVIQYRENIQHDITGIPTADNHWLQIEYYTAGDSEAVSLYLYNFSTESWDSVGNLQGGSSGSPDLFTYPLTGTNYIDTVVGEVRVRYVQPNNDSAQTSLMVDYCRVKSQTIAYDLIWEHRITSLGDYNFKVRIYGYAGSDEAVSIYTWNGAWQDSGQNLPTTTANWVEYEITSDYVIDGNVSIKYVCDDASDKTQTNIYIDYCSVKWIP